MHEIGALTKALDLVERIAQENGAQQVKFITLEVGELTGFLPVFFEKYFPVCVADRPILQSAELRIQVVKGQALCTECQTLYNIMRHEGKCPKCQSREKMVLGGQDFMVKDIGI